MSNHAILTLSSLTSFLSPGLGFKETRYGGWNRCWCLDGLCWISNFPKPEQVRLLFKFQLAVSFSVFLLASWGSLTSWGCRSLLLKPSIWGTWHNSVACIGFYCCKCSCLFIGLRKDLHWDLCFNICFHISIPLPPFDKWWEVLTIVRIYLSNSFTATLLSSAMRF